MCLGSEQTQWAQVAGCGMMDMAGKGSRAYRNVIAPTPAAVDGARDC